MSKKFSLSEQISQSLDHLLDILKKGEPLEKHFRMSRLRRIVNKDGTVIDSRIDSKPNGK